MHELIRRTTLTTTRWLNDADRKADIATGPAWHVGFAWLDQDAPFSNYAGHDRTITLVDGPGFALHFADRTLDVDRLHAPTAFDGGDAALCRIRGACVVLNAMTARDACRHSVLVGTDGEIACGDGEVVVAVVLDGSVGIEGAGDRAGPLDAIRIRGRARLGGGAKIAVIRVAGI